MALYKHLWEHEVENIITFSMSFLEHTFITSEWPCHSLSFVVYRFTSLFIIT